MNTLHVINTIDSTVGGQVYALLNILLMEKELGIASTILTSDSKNIDKAFIENSSFQMFPYSYPKRFYNSKGAVNYFRKNHNMFDLIVLHGVWSFLLYRVSAIASKNKIPIVMWPHGSLDPFDLKKKYLAKKIFGYLFINKLIRKLNFLICTSDRERDEIETYGVEKETKVVPLPIKKPDFIGSRENFRQKNNIKSNDFVFLFLSRIDYKKGLEILIPAFKNVLDNAKVKLMIAGRGEKDYEHKIKVWIKKYGLEKDVLFLGFLSDQEKADAFCGSDCFVLPSLNENFGIAIFEALQFGLPVLISNNVYLHNSILKYEAGWLCQYSTSSLIREMNSVCSDHVHYKKVQSNAKKAGEQFSPSKLVSYYENLYKDLRIK
tara:strand:+ start:12299 stop:13429 length:1131 start_codon:yes stop_codon:yes gene_type:complete